MIKAVLFDFDGVLCDAVASAKETAKQVLEHFGVDCKAIDGAEIIKIGRVKWYRYNFEPVFAEVAAQLHKDTYLKRCDGVERVHASIREVFDKLDRVKKAIVSNNHHSAVDTILESNGVRDLFSAVICRSDAERKPSPDGILKALAILGVKPEEAIMVGDSVSDMAAGRAAGVKTCGISAKGRLRGADITIRDIKSLPRAIGNLSRQQMRRVGR